MKVTRRSQMTGVEHTLDLPITEEQLARWERGTDLIQNVFPGLTPGQREFLLSGTTEEEWDAAFGDDE